MSTMRVVPSGVLMVTSAGCSFFTVPIICASTPSGWRFIACNTDSAASGATIAISLPSLATYSGSRPKQLARASNLFVDRKSTFFEFDPHPRTLSDFVQRAGNTTSSRITHATNVARYAEHLRHQRVQRRAVALDLGLEFEPFTLRQNRDAVITDRTA